MSPTALTLTRLRRNGFIACPVERWIAQAGIHKDAFGFADVLAAHPTRQEIVLVQATTAAHVAHRLAKAKGRPELRQWLAAGGLFAVWGWTRRGKAWAVKIVEVQAGDLSTVLITAPARRGRRAVQRGLYDALDLGAVGAVDHAPAANVDVPAAG